MPFTSWAGAFGPCTAASAIRIGVGIRRWTVRMMSWIAAPLRDVTTPIRRGNRGSGRFFSGANIPSAASLLLELLERERLGAGPRGLREVGVELHLAVALVDPEPPAHAQPLAGLDAKPQLREPRDPTSPPAAPRPDRAARSRGAPKAGCDTCVTSPSSQTKPSWSSAAAGEPDHLGDAEGLVAAAGTRPPSSTSYTALAHLRRNRAVWRGVVRRSRMPIAMAEPAVETGAADRQGCDRSRAGSSLARPRPKIGVITAAGLVFLCVYFLIRLGPDRRFAGGPAAPDRVSLADIAAGRVSADRFVKLDGAELVMAHAVRTSTNKKGLGLRIAPVRGTGEKLWVAMTGDGWAPPMLGAYAGRLRTLKELPFAHALAAYAAEHPRPVFAPASAVRAAFATGKLTSVTGDPVEVKDGDEVAFDAERPRCGDRGRHVQPAPADQGSVGRRAREGRHHRHRPARADR